MLCLVTVCANLSGMLTDQRAAGDFGSRIRQRREDAHLTLIELMIEVRQRLPRSRWVTNETLRSYENGTKTEDKADPVVVAALADVFGCSIADLSPTIAESSVMIRDLLLRLTGGPKAPPGRADNRRTRKTGWTIDQIQNAPDHVNPVGILDAA